MSNGEVVGYAGDSGSRVFGGALPLNSWVHVALSVVWSGAKSFTKIFVNGVETSNRSSSNTPNFNQTVKIGIPDPYPNPNGFLEFEGGLNNVRIWNTAYTSINPNRVVAGTESDLVMSF
ncbi:MAG: LamG domain-containing protein [Saprospiraceae bacterium]|nr:LamG domain-containing protein [Saprospiraceae bacterium]